MRKFSKILAIITAVLVVALTLSIAVFAENEEPVVVATVAADAAGTDAVEYYTLDEAFAAAQAGQYVTIKANSENYAPAETVAFAEGVYVVVADGVTFTVSDDTAFATKAEVDTEGAETGKTVTWKAEYMLEYNGAKTKRDDEDFRTDVLACAANKEAKFTLLADFSYDTAKTSHFIECAKTGSTITIDLNGYDMLFPGASGGSGSFLFRVANTNQTFNIYSSKPGAVFSANGLRLAGHKSARDNTVVNIGNGTDNLSLYCATVFYSSTIGGSAVETSTTNINGGYVYTSGAFFTSRVGASGKNILNVENAVVVGAQAYNSTKVPNPAFITYATLGVVEATFKNSSILSVGSYGVLVQPSITGTIVLDNCDVYCPITNDKTTAIDATVSAQNGTRLTQPSSELTGVINPATGNEYKTVTQACTIPYTTVSASDTKSATFQSIVLPTKAASDGASVQFVIGSDVLDYGYAGIGEKAPNYYGASPEMEDRGEGLFYAPVAGEWEYSVAGSEFAAFEGMTEDIVAAVNAVIAEGSDGIVTLRPVFEEQQAYFSIDDDGTLTYYFEESDAQALTTTLNSLNGTVKVKLYQTVICHAGTAEAERASDAIIMADNDRLDIDVNGNTLAVAYLSSGKGLIQPRANCVVNLYSSKQNGVITLRARLFNEASGRTKGATLNIGEFTDGTTTYSGNNLSVYATQVFYTAGNAEGDAENTLNIKGGDYNVACLLRARGYWKLNVEGIRAICRLYVVDDSNGAAGYVHADIKDSYIIAMDDAKQTMPISVYLDNEGSYILFENCHISATIKTDLQPVMFKNCFIATTTSSEENFKTYEDAEYGKFICVEGEEMNETVTLYTINEQEDGSLTIDPIERTKEVEYKFYTTLSQLPTFEANAVYANIVTQNNGFWINFLVRSDIETNREKVNEELIAYGDAEYNLYVVEAVSPAAVAKAKIRLYTEKVDGYTCYLNAEISLPGYFNIVLTDVSYSEEAKDLAANAANYCAAVYERTNGSASEEYTAILDATDREDTTVTTEAVEEIYETGIVTSATLIVSTNGNVATLAFGNAGAEVDLVAKYTNRAGKTVSVDLVQNGDYYLLEAEISVYDMLGVFEIYNGDTLVAEYSIAAYFTDNAEPDAVVEAFYGYAKAALAYQENK